MRLNVSLGGYATAWRFDGSNAFDDWVDNGNWQESGGVKSIQVPSIDYFKRFSDSIQQALAASLHTNDVRTIRLCYPDPRLPARSVELMVLEQLDVLDEPREFQRLLDASRVFERRPVACIVASQAHAYAEALAESEQFIERIEKVGGRVRPAIVLLTTVDSATLRPPLEMFRGWPLQLRLCDPGASDPENWRRYVHCRIAWETAGSLRLGEVWDGEHSFASLPFGDDDRIEERLNEAALATYARLPTETVEALETLEQPASPHDEARDATTLNRLRKQGVIWNATGSHHDVVSPWAARAVLLGHPSRETGLRLRDALNCIPLASEMLYRLFALEAQERAACYRNMPDSGCARDETQRLFAAFQAGDPNCVVHRFYPSQSPAKISEIWQFASFGEILSQTRDRVNRLRHDARKEVRGLRNALSHGHYTSWRMLVEVRRLSRLLS